VNINSELCEARQPDGHCARCIREAGHSGAHQTFVSEWQDGEGASRRRQRPVFRRVLESRDSLPRESFWIPQARRGQFSRTHL
jgi:hypothetical protein